MFVLTTSGIPCALKSPERQIWRLCPLEAADMALRGPFSDHNSALRGGGQQGRTLRSTHTPAAEELCDQAVLPLVLVTAATSLAAKRCMIYLNVGQGTPK